MDRRQRGALRRALHVTTALAGPVLLAPLLPHEAAAQTLPAGATVTYGEAAISQSGSSLLVTQTSRNAILNWNSFSIGGGASAHFENGTGATLNRVTGNLPSFIDGTLTATGSLYLVNPAGVAVGTGGMVRAGGSFVASTHDLSDGDFLGGGDMVLAGSSKAGIVNKGVIASLGGDVVLTARRVENAGTILAPQGDVGLLAGYEVLLRDLATEEGRFAVRVGGPDTEVVNTGAIRAANVELRANGGNVHALAGNTKGVVKATGVRREGGRIFLTAGQGGTVKATQRLVAKPAPQRMAALPEDAPLPQERPRDAGGVVRIAADHVILGGEIDVSGDAVPGGTIIAVAREQLELTATAGLDASGSDGGLILLGGDFQGGANAGNAYWHEDIGTTRTTLVSEGATIRADGTTGAGGNVVVWGDGHAGFSGSILATGVTRGGDAEVSGKATLAYAGTADLRASDGAWGTLLLDPYDLAIVAGEAGTIAAGAFTSGPGTSQLGADTLAAALGTASVVVQTGGGGPDAGDITVAAAIAWDTNATLTLRAHNDILINADIAATGTQAGLVLEYGAGRGYHLDGGRITLSGEDASLSIGGQSYTLIRDAQGLQAMQNNRAGRYALAMDIDASATAAWNGGAGFAPVGSGTGGGRFSGTLAGLGHVIEGLTINRPGSDVGLIGSMSNTATIRDLGLEGGSVTGGQFTGGLVGYKWGGTITRAYNTGTVNGSSYVGGLVGRQQGGSITQSYATGAVRASSFVGGLVGYVENSSVRQSYATGAVTGNDDVGGLVGRFEGTGTISQSYATGAATILASTGYRHVGGLVGQMGLGSTGLIEHSYATGAVSVPATPNARPGGLVGYQANGSVRNSYWDTYTTGQPNGRFNTTSPREFGVTAVTSNPAQSSAANYAYKASAYANLGIVATSLDANAGWYMVEGETRPFGAWEYSTAIADAHQLQLMAMDLSASYTLARDIDATATGAFAGMWSQRGFSPVGDDGNGFTGALDGRDHVISGLVIDRPNEDAIGLFGQTAPGAHIRNVGLEGGSIKGEDHVGGLIGLNGGTVTRSHATGAVSGAGSVGGLVGRNIGTVEQSYATGTVTASGNFAYVGGLVGEQSAGAIAQSYATGAVASTSNNAYVGGLVGGQQNGSTITNSYATGALAGGHVFGGLVGQQTGGSAVSHSYATGAVPEGGQGGGLVGFQDSSTVAASYWNVDTTGRTTSAGGDGLTTAQLQAGLPAGFNPALWGIVPGVSYPYHLWRFVSGPSVISGTATGIDGGDGRLGVGIGIDGKVAAQGHTGADGYYHFMLDPLGAGSAAIAWLTQQRFGGTATASYANAAGETIAAAGFAQGHAAGLDLHADTVHARTALATLGDTYRMMWRALYGDRTGAPLYDQVANADDVLVYDVDPDCGCGPELLFGPLDDRTSLLVNASAPLFTIDAVPVSAPADVAILGSGDIHAVDGTSIFIAGAIRLEAGGTLSLGDGSFFIGDSLTFRAGTDLTAEGLLIAGGTGATDIAAGGDITFRDYDIPLPTNGLVTTVGGDTLRIRAGGDLTLGNATMLTGFADGDAVVLSAGGVFTNNFDPDLLGDLGIGSQIELDTGTYPGARWLVYLADPDGGHAFGALDSGNTAIWNTAYPNAVAATGNRYVFAYRPTATFTADSPGKTYGETLDLTGAFTVSGLHQGVAGAFLADTLVGAFSGAPLLASGGAAATANVGGGSEPGGAYLVSIDGSGVTSPSGYGLDFAGGLLTVTPRQITVTAQAGQSKVYGDDDPAFLYDVTGGSLVHGQNFTGALARESGENAGTHAFTAGTLRVEDGNDGGNYLITFDGMTNRFAITPATLIVTAHPGSKTYGDNDPDLTFSATGFRFADGVGGLTGALARAAGETVAGGPYAITRGTLDAGSNYTIAFTGAGFSITPRPITVAADDLRKPVGQPDPALRWTITGGSIAGFDTHGSVFSGALARDPGELQGTYAIGQGTLLANGNYVLTFLPGTLTIDPPVVTMAGLPERSLPFATPHGQAAGGALGLCDAGVLPQDVCAVYTHPANRGLDHVRFAP